MKPWTVNMVTAFGRGESLALALHDKGFDVGVLDLTEAFPSEYRRGAGPFPIVRQNYLGAHEAVFAGATPLPRGLVLWLRDGPVEFGGPAASFFAEMNPAFRAAVQNEPSTDFETDWIRRFLRRWVSPFHHEQWESDAGALFPVARPAVLVPRASERAEFGFDRIREKNFFHVCRGILDLQIESGRVTEVEVDAGTAAALRAARWIWCLSSHETEMLNAQVAATVFSSDVRRPEWHWTAFEGQCERGPWSDGFPKYSVVIEDAHLSWTYENVYMLEWLDQDRFLVWVKLPAEGALDVTRHDQWIKAIEGSLGRRLHLGKWRIDASSCGICPHSPVLPGHMKEWRPPGWKNWDWIAPETVARLDMGARFEREMDCFQRLLNWRTDQLNREGARGDQALHPS